MSAEESELTVATRNINLSAVSSSSNEDLLKTKKKAVALSKDSLSWNDLIEELLRIFQTDDVNIEEVEELLARYKSSVADWKRFAKFDKYKYTRNLVHEGNGRFNLMLLCWAEGNQSTIHDHANAHCFVKVLDGSLREIKYYWPEERKNEDGSMVVKEVADGKVNDVVYMSDELGLHRMENPSHSDKTVSLHLYSPPFKSCTIFDERTCSQILCPMTFWSKFGEKVNHKRLNKSKTSFTLVPQQTDKKEEGEANNAKQLHKRETSLAIQQIKE